MVSYGILTDTSYTSVHNFPKKYLPQSESFLQVNVIKLQRNTYNWSVESRNKSNWWWLVSCVMSHSPKRFWMHLCSRWLMRTMQQYICASTPLRNDWCPLRTVWDQKHYITATTDIDTHAYADSSAMSLQIIFKARVGPFKVKLDRHL